MANTVYGPFAAINVVNGSTPANATWGNNVQTQASVALNSFTSDFGGPFVHDGITCTKDGVTANQLDIASGTAYLTMSDGTIAKIAVTSDNTHTTSTPSTTYHLYLQPDGTWYWSTSNSPAANSLALCNVATDGSGNISSVTDLRTASGAVRALGIVAQANATAVNVTTDQIMLTYTPTVDGWYRAHMTLQYVNGTPQKPVGSIHWWSPEATGFSSAYFIELLGGNLMNGSQATTPGTNQMLACVPITFRQKAGQSVNVHFQDGGGTPSDKVSAAIERLS